MSKQNVMVFQNMRPPVAAERGHTPLRSKQAKVVFQLANVKFEDRSVHHVTKEQIVTNYTDDGNLQDSVWDRRHHVTPSYFNTKNTRFYKVNF